MNVPVRLAIAYLVLFSFPIVLWLAMELIAWKDRQLRRAIDRKRARRMGLLDFTMPPPPSPYDGERDRWSS